MTLKPLDFQGLFFVFLFSKLIKMKYFLFLTAVALFGLMGCKKQLSEEEQLEIDLEIIRDYITENNLDAEYTASGLHYVIQTPGFGNHPHSMSNVRVRYTGKFINNSIFDQSGELGATFNLQGVIKGWTEGIPFFREGGEGILILPSKLGYGPNGNSSIPANSVLVFEVKLLEIVP
jgi:FKBP-type peptidyl-prolyl cis-trans isomerase FkpA